MTTETCNLLGLDQAALTAWLAARGQRAFHARQLMAWIYRRRCTNFDAMTDLSMAFRAVLKEQARIVPPELVDTRESRDGTRKWLLDSGTGNRVEMVFIPEADRGTLCISSQVGCAMDCAFCATGAQGFNRNLTSAEIVGQLWLANKLLPPRTCDLPAVSNVVFMGMGEPLANYRNLLPAIRIFTDPLGFNLSKRRVTVSTSGLVPAMDRLSEEGDVSLAISLHAPDNALRDELVPINRRHPVEELMAACRRYIQGGTHRHVLIEYVMLDGVNDTDAHARRLARRLNGLNAKVNLIPFNPYPDARFECSSRERIDCFREILLNAGIMTVTRRTRGDDIEAACGQLAGQVRDRTRHRIGARRLQSEITA
ncbi:MAG: 23S rRNA (adenine(2503)-C(2))-methyltransferase RlmN [Gammaproteobacteria bacterium]|nr:23S rRNA (adenine(2503)-C(2))-methyltransferase RlmN [Gammaproteobacteria bacterium]